MELHIAGRHLQAHTEEQDRQRPTHQRPLVVKDSEEAPKGSEGKGTSGADPHSEAAAEEVATRAMWGLYGGGVRTKDVGQVIRAMSPRCEITVYP